MTYDPMAHPHTIITGPRLDGSFCLTFERAAWEARYPGHSLDEYMALRAQQGDATEVTRCEINPFTAKRRR